MSADNVSLSDYFRQQGESATADAGRGQLDRRRRQHLKVWQWAGDLTLKRGRSLRAASNQPATPERDRLVREEFAFRVTALGRYLARAEGEAALTWWRGKAEDPVQRALVTFAMSGRADLVVELLDAVRLKRPTVLRDLLFWLRHCADALEAEWWSAPAPHDERRQRDADLAQEIREMKEQGFTRQKIANKLHLKLETYKKLHARLRKQNML
jgi:hypothetical protein